jgi:hypothetical protein
MRSSTRILLFVFSVLPRITFAQQTDFSESRVREVVLRSGTSFTGIVVLETADSLAIRLSDGRRLSWPLSEVKMMRAAHEQKTTHVAPRFTPRKEKQVPKASARIDKPVAAIKTRYPFDSPREIDAPERQKFRTSYITVGLPASFAAHYTEAHLEIDSWLNAAPSFYAENAAGSLSIFSRYEGNGAFLHSIFTMAEGDLRGGVIAVGHAVTVNTTDYFLRIGLGIGVGIYGFAAITQNMTFNVPVSERSFVELETTNSVMTNKLGYHRLTTGWVWSSKNYRMRIGYQHLVHGISAGVIPMPVLEVGFRF